MLYMSGINFHRYKCCILEQAEEENLEGTG